MNIRLKWLDVVRNGLFELGGVSTLPEIYAHIERTRPRPLIGDWHSTVRQTLEDHSPDSASHRTGKNIFRRLGPGKRAGRWALSDAVTLAEKDNGVASAPDLTNPIAALVKGTDRANALRAEGEELVEPFDPRDERDGRHRVLANLVQRQGQAAFRRKLLNAYRGQCAITGWDVADVLEAAHIIPYRGEHTSHVSNGLLLRSDLHALFDLHLIEIDPETYSVVLDSSLVETPYGEFHERRILLPADTALWPSTECLQLHSKPDRS